MTNRERFLIALRRGIPDKVPLAPLIHRRFAYRYLGGTDWRPVFELHQRLGTTSFRGPTGVDFKVEWPSGFGQESHTVQFSDGRKTTDSVIMTPKGRLTSHHVSGLMPHDPTVGRTMEYLVKSPEDWPKYKAHLEAWLEVSVTDLSEITKAHKAMGEEGIASAAVPSVFHQMSGARGMEGILLDLYDCPDILAAVWEVQQAVTDRYIEGFIQSPSEVLSYDVCWASGARMGPKHFGRWQMPDIARAAERIHRVPGKYFGLYALGRIRELLPMMVDAGIDFLGTFEPNEGDITLAEAKRLYGDRMCVMGNYDCVVLSFGTRQQAFEEARRCLQEGMEGGGFVLVTGDEVPADAKWENLEAMRDAVEQLGNYA